MAAHGVVVTADRRRLRLLTARMIGPLSSFGDAAADADALRGGWRVCRRVGIDCCCCCC